MLIGWYETLPLIANKNFLFFIFLVLFYVLCSLLYEMEYVEKLDEKDT